VFTRCTLFLIVALSLIVTPALAEDPVLDEELQQLANRIRNGESTEVIDDLERMTTDHPESSMAFALLANARHSNGEYRLAAEANREAAKSASLAPSARYNEACAWSLLGELEAAKVAIDQALEAGFLDFDLMTTDSDLDQLRAKYEIAMPAEHEYVDFRGDNGVEMAYHVVLPAGYERGRTYRTVVFFPPGSGSRSADWALENWVAEENEDWIVVLAVGPARGWFTHPSHHALEDMLDELKRDLNPAGETFHVAGFGEGARVATTYSRMSGAYFSSLTTFGATHWGQWDADDLSQSFASYPVTMVVGGQDEVAVSSTALATASIPGAQVQTIKGDDHRLLSLHGGGFTDYLSRDPAEHGSR
jgi:tetratricopeptide (TPR) repeat protein